MAVGVIQRLQHAVHDGEHLRRRYRSVVHPLAQRAPADELEDQVVDVPLQLHVVDLDKVRVAGPGHHLRLLKEALQGDRVGRLDQLLDRDLTAEAGLLGEVDSTHPATAELALDAVLADVVLAGDLRRSRNRSDWRRRHGGRRDRDESHRCPDVRRRFLLRPAARFWRRRPCRRGRLWRGFWRLTGIGHRAASLTESFHLPSGMAFCGPCPDNLARSSHSTGGD